MRAILLVASLAITTSHAVAATPRYVAADALIDHYELPADQLARTSELVHAGHMAYMVRELLALIVLVAVLRLGIAAALARWADRRTPRTWLQLLLVASLTLTTVELAKLPVALALFGLAGATAWPIQAGFSIVVGAIVAAVVYAIIRRSPRGWWWRVWLFALPLVVGMQLAGPELERRGASRLVDRDPPLVDRIERFAERRGVSIDPDRIFVLASPTPDAHSTGIGPSRAIFVNEGALDELDDRELGFLLAHEVGHFDGPAIEMASLAFVALALAAVLAAVSAIIGAVVRRRGIRWGIPALASPASLPVGLIAIAVLGPAATPIRALVQRRIEHQADANGLQILAMTDADPRQAAAHMLQRVGEIYGMPARDGVLDVICGVDHPSIGDRIAFVLGAQPTTGARP